jgi:hypothetical protein
MTDFTPLDPSGSHAGRPPYVNLPTLFRAKFPALTCCKKPDCLREKACYHF